VTKRFIALDWAVEPLAFSVGLPPHCTSELLAPPPPPPDALVVLELLSEPQAERRTALSATRLRAAVDLRAPRGVSFT